MEATGLVGAMWARSWSDTIKDSINAMRVSSQSAPRALRDSGVLRLADVAQSNFMALFTSAKATGKFTTVLIPSSPAVPRVSPAIC